MSFRKITLITILVFSGLFPYDQTNAATVLSGRILLQVQDKGQAWYVSPTNNKRYYLGTPQEAFLVMRSLGLGISNKDFLSLQNKLPSRLLGRIIIKTEDQGKAYYINPVTRQLAYLGRPQDAFLAMRNQGLGITNSDLNKITAAKESSPRIENPSPTNDQKEVKFTWRYKNKDYYLNELFSKSLYEKYTRSTKVLTYSSDNPPANPRDTFYSIFLKPKESDDSLDRLLSDLKRIAAIDGYQGDELIEFILAFVQYIPYDHAKEAGENKPNYPYETLYKNSGVCSDKTFLANTLLRRLNYGAIIMDFPDINHTAIGIQCPQADSIFNSGYCYIETTNYFPIGILPQSINQGIASSSAQINQAFNASSLGQVEYYQKTSGLLYRGIGKTKNQITAIISLEKTIEDTKIEITKLQNEINQAKTNLGNLKAQLDIYWDNQDSQNYNTLVATYNAAIKEYNQQLTEYQAKIGIYNDNVNKYNQARVDLFQE